MLVDDLEEVATNDMTTASTNRARVINSALLPHHLRLFGEAQLLFTFAKFVQDEFGHRTGDAAQDRRSEGSDDRANRRGHQAHKAFHKLRKGAVISLITFCNFF